MLEARQVRAVPDVSRSLGLAGAALIACLAFLGGHAIAGSGNDPAEATPRSELPKGSAPTVLGAARHPVALPVISVRELPLLAAPHQKKEAPAATAPSTPNVQAPIIRRTYTPPVTKPKTTPKTTPNTGNGGGGGGYFDDSG